MMKNLVFCTIIFLVGLMSCVAGARVKENVTCPEDFENIHRQCFRFINETKKWEDALEFCRTLNSDLASLEALQEKEAVNEFIKENYETATNFWFGYRKRTVTGNHEWEWIPSELVVQDRIVPWLKQSYKRKSGKRYCGGILFTPNPPSKRRTGTMYLNNERCTKKQFFVCEHHPPAPSKDAKTEATTTATATTTAEAATTTTTATTTTATTTTTAPTTTATTLPSTTSDSYLISTEKKEDIATEEPQDKIADEGQIETSSMAGEEKELKTPILARAPCQGFGGSHGDAALYRKYLNSAIRTNEAKVQYYLKVSKLYADALEVQRNYYTSLQEKLELELAEARART